MKKIEESIKSFNNKKLNTITGLTEDEAIVINAMRKKGGSTTSAATVS